MGSARDWPRAVASQPDLFPKEGLPVAEPAAAAARQMQVGGWHAKMATGHAADELWLRARLFRPTPGQLVASRSRAPQAPAAPRTTLHYAYFRRRPGWR